MPRAPSLITEIAGEVGTKLRNRSRNQTAGPRYCPSGTLQSQGKLQQNYRKLLESTSRVVGQAKRFSKEIADRVKQSKDPLKQLALDGLRREIDTMVPPIKQVMKQTRARIFRGDTHDEDKIFSLFEPSTEIIRKGQGRQAQRVR